MSKEEMEVEEPKKRVATQEEKRECFRDLLKEFIAGDNVLSKYLARKVLVHMEPEDQECLLNRLMKIPDTKQIMVLHTLNGLLLQCDVVKRQDKEGNVSLQLEYSRLDMTDDHLALKKAKKTPPPTVRVLFKQILPPTKEEGGWLCKDASHPRIVAWHKLFNDYGSLLWQSSNNAGNVPMIWEHDMPCDYSVMISPLVNKETLKKEIMRFTVYEPYPLVQKGFDMFITDVRRK